MSETDSFGRERPTPAAKLIEVVDGKFLWGERLGCGKLAGYSAEGDPLRCEWGNLCSECETVTPDKAAERLLAAGFDVREPTTDQIPQSIAISGFTLSEED